MARYLCPNCWKPTRKTPAESIDDTCDTCQGVHE